MVKNLIPLVLSVVIFFLACELVVRYQVHAWPFERALHFADYLTARDTTLRWRFSPSGGRNSLGLRNRELNPKKTGTLRILFLGDSLIWSGETSSGELYTEVLERRFNARFTNEQSAIEVINAGIPGYTTYQELEFLKIYGMDMKPDFVVLGFVFNDLFYKYLHKPTERSIIDIEPAAKLYRFDPFSFPGVFLARSHFAHMIVAKSEVIWQRLLRRPGFPFERRGDFFLAWKSYGWDSTRNLMGEMETLLREKEIPLIVLVFPISDQVDDQYRKLDESYVLYPQTKIREICDAYGIPMLDLTEPLYRNGGKALFKDYLHLNGEGNDIVADQVEEFLMNHLRRMENMKKNG